MDWTTITRAEWISATSVAISLVAATYTWRNFRLSARKERREIEATKPVVEFEMDASYAKELPWIRTVMTVRNRLPHRVHIAEISVRSPTDGRLVDRNKVHGIETNLVGDHPKEMLDAAASRTWRPIRRMAEPAGREGHTARVGIVLLQLDRAVDYTLDLVLEEPLAERRRSTVTVKIKLPAAISSPAKATMS